MTVPSNFTPKGKSLLTVSLERALDGIGDGKTLTAVCAIKGIPLRPDVLRAMANSSEVEAQMLAARRIGVWAQLDGATDKFLAVVTSELPGLKELAKHTTWLASKLVHGTFVDKRRTQKEIIEVGWMDSPANSNTAI
tara:strand:- start:2924 stop:3334 length:411 start_codon:yes stop_codon:yes gene_type:complete